MTERYAASALATFATELLRYQGLDPGKAEATARVLLEGDLLGHTTHGLALLAPYLDEAAAGRMRGQGSWAVVNEAGAAQTWDGQRLPGPWLIEQAADWAAGRAREAGIAAVSVRRSCHIGCLAAYLQRIALGGQMLVIACSDPSTASVAPFGGTRRMITPNPLAAGWPSPGGPVLIDVSMSITTNGMTNRLARESRRFDHPWLLDAEGEATDDPATFAAGGTLLPLGGVESGHKGYALGLLIEALTAALGGFGRADAPADWGAAVLVMVIDPARFGGLAAFTREAGWIEDAVHANPPVAAGTPPRLPGERALRLRAEQLASGVALHPSIVPALREWARSSGLDMPQPLP